jgi:tetratricopeptide (TPR) repeat protein
VLLRIEGAARAQEEALGISRGIGSRPGQAETVNEAGTLHWVRGDPVKAGSCHRRALELARQIGSALEEAQALAGLGWYDLADGRTAEAEDRLRQALEIFQRIGAAEPAEVSAELAALTGASPAPRGSSLPR